MARVLGALVLLLAAQRQPSGTIAGRVTEQGSGQPLPRIVVTLISTEQSRTEVVTDADGRYLFSGLKPGKYAIGAAQDEHRSTYLWQWYGEAAPGARFGAPQRLNVELSAGENKSARAANDRTFTLKGSFGRRVLDVAGVPRGWFVKSIRYGTTEVIDEPIEFKDTRGEAPSLDVVLSNHGAVVTGGVADDAGNAAPRALILMLRTRANGMAEIHDTTASATGAFKLGPVRQGDYAIVALPAGSPYPQAGEWERLARLAGQGERVTLGELDERLVDLRVLATERR